MSIGPKLPKVVVFVQENHTTDCYFSSLRAWGANVTTGWPAALNPPASDQPHDRAAFFRWLKAREAGRSYAPHVQYDTSPPPYGSTIAQPAPPIPTPAPNPVPATSYRPRPLDPIYLTNGTTMPAANDAPLPPQSSPPA